MDLYFDNAATTRLSDKAREAWLYTEKEFYANPSSVHREGLKARKELDRNRELIASRLGVSPSTLFFTSGATEAIATVLSSLFYLEPGKVIFSRAEHEAVLSWEPFLKKLGWETVEIRARQGRVDPMELRSMMTPDVRLVAIMAVNNVTGAVNDIPALGKVIREKEAESRKRVLFFSDSVQALGKIDIRPVLETVDAASFSAHKLNGPRGIGMLYLKKPEALRPLAPGGGQERGKRGGTENLPAIAAFRQAVEEWVPNNERGRIAGLNRYLRGELETLGLTLLSPEDASPYILSFASPLPSEVFTRMLSDKGIAVSSGSACSNNARGEGERSLSAMGFPPASAKRAVRVSFSNSTSMEDVEYLAKAIKEAVNG